MEAAGAVLAAGVSVLFPQPATVATSAPATASVSNFFKIRPSLKGMLFVYIFTIMVQKT
ncbi:hypothetical protein D3C86_1961070 [compost metagenome]